MGRHEVGCVIYLISFFCICLLLNIFFKLTILFCISLTDYIFIVPHNSLRWVVNSFCLHNSGSSFAFAKDCIFQELVRAITVATAIIWIHANDNECYQTRFSGIGFISTKSSDLTGMD